MLRGLFEGQKTPTIRGDGILLRGALAGDYREWRAVRLESRAFLKPFEPRWTEADLNQRIFKTRLRRGRQETAAGREHSFFIYRVEGKDHRLVGGITLSNIRRRVAQHVSLGYWMGVNDAGTGIMSGAVGAILPFVFDTMGLHRIHAACLPDNVPSRRVLERNGFVEEGFATNYLQIDGSWRDHVLYGLTYEHYSTAGVGDIVQSL